MRLRTAARSGRRGLAVAEFAILAPFLVFLVLGTLEVSRAAMVCQALNDAARSACRQGIQGGVSTQTIKNTAADAIKDVPLKPAVTVIVWVNNSSTADASTAVHGDTITVEITVPFSAVSWTTSVFMSGDTLVSKKVSMMRQQ
jgi:Flp pilus assembly protein TadG